MFDAPPFESVAVLALREDKAGSWELEHQAVLLRESGIKVLGDRASINTSSALTYEQMGEKLQSNKTEELSHSVLNTVSQHLKM